MAEVYGWVPESTKRQARAAAERWHAEHPEAYEITDPEEEEDEYSETSAKEDARNAWQHDGDPDYDTGSLAKEDRRNARYS
jgi:hypothetical protein